MASLTTLLSGFCAQSALAYYAYDWQPETVSTDEDGFGNRYFAGGSQPGSKLTLASRTQPAVSTVRDVLVKALQDRARPLERSEITALQVLLPASQPRPSELKESSGGKTYRLGGQDVAAIWTVTAGRSKNKQLDFWVLKPINKDVQMMHLRVEAAEPMSEIGALDDFIARASSNPSDSMEFKSRDGKIIASANTRVTGGKSEVVLQLSLQRRSGAKAVPYFISTISGAENPRMVIDRDWQQDDKQVLILLTSSKDGGDLATLVVFDSAMGKVVQSMTGLAILESDNIDQRGIVVKEPISTTGYGLPRFYFFNNDSGRLSEMTSFRIALARNELNTIKYKSLLTDPDLDESTTLALAVLMLAAEGDYAARGGDLLDRVRDSAILKADKKLHASLRPTLQFLSRNRRR